MRAAVPGHPYHDGPVTCLDFHPSTPGLILTGSEDNTARLVSASSGRVLGSLSAHVETVETVGLSGDFNFGASGAIDGKLVVWDLNTLAQRSVAQHDKAVSMLQWIPGTACLYRCEKHFFCTTWVVFLFRAARRKGFFFSNRYATKGPRPADGAGAAVDTSLRDPNARYSYGIAARPFANEQPESGDSTTKENVTFFSRFSRRNEKARRDPRGTARDDSSTPSPIGTAPFRFRLTDRPNTSEYSP